MHGGVVQADLDKVYHGRFKLKISVKLIYFYMCSIKMKPLCPGLNPSEAAFAKQV